MPFHNFILLHCYIVFFTFYCNVEWLNIYGIFIMLLNFLLFYYLTSQLYFMFYCILLLCYGKIMDQCSFIIYFIRF